MTTGYTIVDVLIGVIVVVILTRFVWKLRRRFCPVCTRLMKKHTTHCYHCGSKRKN